MNKPSLTKEQAQAIIAKFPELTDKFIILGIRGGDANGTNQVGIYDDIIAIVTPDFFKAYNANTDPSRLYDGVAVLQPGVYQYIKGLHGMRHLNLSNIDDRTIYNKLETSGKDVAPTPGRILPYWAFRQHSNVTVLRQGATKPVTDSPGSRFWIDIHRGGYKTTSSAGCQTIFPDQWEDFRNHGFDAMISYKQPIVSYLLVNDKNYPEILLTQ